jgi:outer membrane protein TolC
MSKLSVRQAQNEYYPKLKFYGHLSQQHFSDNLNINKWYPYTYIGFRLDVPIFDGFQKKNNVDELVFQSQTAEKNLEKTKSDLDYEVKTAWVNLHDSYENLLIWQENIKIAEDVVKWNEVRFKEGAITSTDLISSEATLKDTQTNYMIALYDYLIAKVNWKKAKGEL